MRFTDLHCHALFGCDDGPKSEKDMFSLVDVIYRDNIRELCLTPHFHPGYFGENSEKSLRAFEILRGYVADKYPDMNLYLGNELRYERGCNSWFKDGICRTLNGTKYVLVDFGENQPESDIVNGTHRLLSAGYVPVLAHVERYRKIKSVETVIELKENGVIIQVDSQSILGIFGFGSKRRGRRLLEMGICDVIATDSHGLLRRPPTMTDAYNYVKKYFGENYAEIICVKNPLLILKDQYHGKD